MSELTEKYNQLESGKIADWVKIFSRTSGVPLDRTGLFYSYDDAYAYAKGDGSDARALGKTAYIGQPVVVHGPNEKGKDGVWYYLLAPSTASGRKAELQPVGSGSGSLSVSTLTVKNGSIEEATEDNIGQIIYVTTGTDDYPKGPYIVSGAGTVVRIGTTTATSDLAGDVAQLKTDVSALEAIIGNPENPGEDTLVHDVSKLKKQQEDYLLKTEPATTGVNTVLKTNGNGKIEVDTTGNAETATTATNLESAPALAASGNSVTVTAGGKTSAAFTVPYATKAGSATNATSATNASRADIADELNWDNVTEDICIVVGFVDEQGLLEETSSTTETALIVTHDYDTVFISSSQAALADSKFGVKFASSAQAASWEILCVKSNGFVIPMIYNADDSCHVSRDMIAAGSVIENIEVVVKKIH